MVSSSSSSCSRLAAWQEPLLQLRLLVVLQLVVVPQGVHAAGSEGVGTTYYDCRACQHHLIALLPCACHTCGCQAVLHTRTPPSSAL
jgi:hypothetical protein